jgi:hypothetical protein
VILWLEVFIVVFARKKKNRVEIMKVVAKNAKTHESESVMQNCVNLKD